MTFKVILRLWLSLIFLCGTLGYAAAQSAAEPKRLQVQYNAAYQLQDSYTIIYDNTVQTAKLKEFRVTFYGPDRKVIAQTRTETHPETAKIETYLLDGPVSGFNEVELSILSLHSGNINAFPADIGAILALNELTQIPDRPEPTPPNLTEQDRQRVNDATANISRLLSALDDQASTFSSASEARQSANDQLDRLINDTVALSAKAEDAGRTDLKSEIDTLSSDLKMARASDSPAVIQRQLVTLKMDAQELDSGIKTLVRQSQTVGVEESTVLSALNATEAGLEDLETVLATLKVPDAIDSNQIDLWNETFLALKSQTDTASTPVDPPVPQGPIEPLPPTFNWTGFLVILALAVLLFGAILKSILGAKAKTRPVKSALNRAEHLGVLFPASPMLAGNVAGPLSPAGQLTASQLQMLSGPYTVLREAYQATGRIGYAQVGVPSAEDYAFGTGFLVSDRHVVTNRHVHGLYGHYLLDKTDPGGIEFIAEKGKDASDFVPFNGEPPVLLPELDIAIYTLARPVTNRNPIALKPVETEALDGKDVVVIGYPDTHTPEKAEVLAVVEDDPIFAVKRLSQGQIFRHSTDIDTPYGVKTSVSESKNAAFLMPAICHNASTMGGNSGSPLLDIKNGQLLGVHFKGFKVFNQEEAANLAMAISQLTQSKPLNKLSTVTPITTKADKLS